MPPKFRFHTLLTYKKRIEDECRLEVARADQEVARLRHECDALRNEIAHVAAQTRQGQSDHLNVHQVQYAHMYLQSLEENLAQRRMALRAAEEAAEEARNRLAEAMKARKTLEKLKEYDHQAFMEQLARKERERTDDFNVARYGRTKS